MPQLNPWVNLWIRPRETLRLLLDSKKGEIVIIYLAVIEGFLSAFALLTYLWAIYPQKTALNNGYALAALILLGGLLGLIQLYLGGWLYQFTGAWIKGKGTFRELKCAIGWSFYPALICNCFAILAYFPYFTMGLRIFFGTLYVILALWSFMIFLNLIAEAHRFSAWRALLNFIIVLALLILFFLLVGLIAPLLAPLFQVIYLIG
jgi:hypothetical protein